MTGGVDSTSRYMKTVVRTLCHGVANKDTRQRPIFKLMACIRSKPWITQAAEDSKLVVVRCCLEEFLIWRLHRENRCG